ncbi:MAG: exopolysaccharide biosynthesis polyprenyl glycosylphosphotransferase [Nitrososphaerota archaeon]
MKVKGRILSLLQFLLDVFSVFISYRIWIFLRVIFNKPYSFENSLALNKVYPYLLGTFIILGFIYNLFDVSKDDNHEIFLDIILSTFFLFLLSFSFSFFVRAFSVPRTVLIFSFPIQVVLLLLSHSLIKNLHSYLYPLPNVLIITEKKDAQIFDKELETYWGNSKVKGISVEVERDSLANVLEILKKEHFDFVVIDGSMKDTAKTIFLRELAKLDKKVYIMPSIQELLVFNSGIRFVNDTALFELTPIKFDPLQLVLKRIIDLFISVVALVVLSPLLVIFSVLILIDSGRPIFYLQDRAGLNGKIFKLIKFRTMIKNAEKDTGPILSSESDPRITKIGRFLRKTGFDEIPQFFNVLKGDMSVVGPRPERPELMKEILKKVPEFDLRLKVKPGITGFAQLYGRYDTDFEKKLKMDLLYIKQRNIILTDIYIIFNTLKLFLSPHKRK